MGRGRRRSSSWPPAAPAAMLLLCFFHCVAAAARLLPLQPAAGVPPQVLHQAENNVVKAAAAADGLVVHEAEAAGNGDELFDVSEMMGAEADAAAVCEGENDECLERRLLGDAHLDYIYTQHKGKP